MGLRRSARVAGIEAKGDDKKVKEEDNIAESEPAKKKVKKEVKKEVTEEKKPSGKLEIGDEIPDMTLLDQDGEEVHLKELAKEKEILVVFAYPRASTPGCTRQACGFRDNYLDLKEKATVVGLSLDSPKLQKNFVTKQKLPYNLLCDPKREFIGALGAKKSPSGIIRSHWIFKGGKLVISKVGVSPEASVKGAKEAVLEM